MGRPASWRVWTRRALTAVYVGSYRDPAGMNACVFADPRSGRSIGPLNLQLGARTGWTLPAPRVGAPPDARPGRLGHLEYYGIDWQGRAKGPDREPRGVFLRFEEGADARGLSTLAVDGLLIGLLGDPRKLETLEDPAEIERAHWGLLLARHEEVARLHLARAKPALTEESFRGLQELTELCFRRLVPRFPRGTFADVELAEPGLLQREPRRKLEGCLEPDAGPFADGPGEIFRFLYAAGPAAWKETLRALPQGRETGEVIALGLDAAGRLAALEEDKIRRWRWCSPEPAAGLRFGDVLRLHVQTDRLGWAEAVGRNEAAKAVELLRSAKAAALLARAAEEGACPWEVWEQAADGVKIREALAENPSPEHARRLERRLPGGGDGRERLGAVLAVVVAYWRAGAFEDARILLGRLPLLLPETQDAPVWRASKQLHALLEGRHVHDATEEDRNELDYVWDGTLGPLAEELGFAGRCAEALDNAGRP